MSASRPPRPPRPRPVCGTDRLSAVDDTCESSYRLQPMIRPFWLIGLAGAALARPERWRTWASTLLNAQEDIHTTSDKEHQMTVTLITGANKGLGYETARRLIDLGHTVYIGARIGNVERRRHPNSAPGSSSST